MAWLDEVRSCATEVAAEKPGDTVETGQVDSRYVTGCVLADDRTGPNLNDRSTIDQNRLVVDIEPLLMSIRRVALIGICSLTGEATRDANSYQRKETN